MCLNYGKLDIHFKQETFVLEQYHFSALAIFRELIDAKMKNLLNRIDNLNME